MTINGINGINTKAAQLGINPGMDLYNRNIQDQIANAQKQLQELSSNEKMPLEAKMKRRKEIQQQISDLNMQLRQHQIEQRNEKQQVKSFMDDMFGGTDTKKDGQNAGLSQADVTAMISADASIKQSKVQGSVAGRMEGRADALEIEIELDEARGGDAAKKKEELAEVKQTAMQAADSQMKTLGNANQAMEKAAEAERTEPKTSGSKEENTAQAENKTADSDAKEEVQEKISAGAQEDNIERVQPDNDAQENRTERVQPDNEAQENRTERVQPDNEAQEERTERVQSDSDAQEDSTERVKPDNEAQEERTERVQPDSDAQTPDAQSVQPAAPKVQVVQTEGYPRFDLRF